MSFICASSNPAAANLLDTPAKFISLTPAWVWTVWSESGDNAFTVSTIEAAFIWNNMKNTKTVFIAFPAKVSNQKFFNSSVSLSPWGNSESNLLLYASFCSLTFVFLPSSLSFNACNSASFLGKIPNAFSRSAKVIALEEFLKSEANPTREAKALVFFILSLRPFKNLDSFNKVFWEIRPSNSWSNIWLDNLLL